MANKIMIDLIKKYAVQTTIGIFMLSAICEILFHNASSVSFLVASFGFVFVALKYKLDQAKYHKDLFSKRFEIYMRVEKNLRAWAGNLKPDQAMMDQLEEMLRESYFLFSSGTYQFIKEFRSALINLRFNQKVEESNAFLATLLDRENLPEKFPELKIDNY